MELDPVDDQRHHQAVVQVPPTLLVDGTTRCVEELLDIKLEALMHWI